MRTAGSPSQYSRWTIDTGVSVMTNPSEDMRAKTSIVLRAYSAMEPEEIARCATYGKCFLLHRTSQRSNSRAQEMPLPMLTGRPPRLSPGPGAPGGAPGSTLAPCSRASLRLHLRATVSARAST